MKTEIRKDSEAYARQEAEREAVWQEQYGRKMPELCEKFNEILRGEDDGKVVHLEELLQSNEVKEHYQTTEEIAAVSIGVIIAKRERCSGKNEGILSGITCVEQLESRLRKIRFAVYGMEFLDEESAEEGFCKCIEEERLTIAGVVAVIIMIAVHPLRVMLSVERFFEKRSMYGMEILLLQHVTQMWKGNQRLTCKLADLYEMMQKEESAACQRQELLDYGNVGGGKEEIYVLQEKLWRLRYGEQEAAEEILVCIEETQRGEQFLLWLTDQEKSWTPEEYLVVADAWFAVGKSHIGQGTLEIGNRKTEGEVQKILRNIRDEEKADE